jgi:hypothetical protein
MQSQIPQRLPCEMERYEIIMSHVPAHARGRQDDDVFARHVSDAGHDRAWYVPRPHGPESLQLHPMLSEWVSQKTCSVRRKPLVASPESPKMSNRLGVLAMIHTMMTRIKNAATREQRFNLLENAQILTVILQEVTMYEKSLLMDLDVE